jgi:ABC-type dipeptide/oligopeptide/nickel transport system ATPase subunit
VDGVSFTLARGRTLGLVGESGCGKSTLGRCLLRLHDADRGAVLFDGVDLMKLTERELAPYRKRLQVVFQDPYASLNPRQRVDRMLQEVLDVHNIGAPSARRRRVDELLVQVGLSPADGHKYPGEFSGGQRQRVGIARALAVEPELLIADEPLSALDVSIQAQILQLLLDLRASLGLTMIFISHDLRVVRYLSDEVAVMYLGTIVERAPTAELFARPSTPTRWRCYRPFRRSEALGESPRRSRASLRARCASRRAAGSIRGAPPGWSDVRWNRPRWRSSCRIIWSRATSRRIVSPPRGRATIDSTVAPGRRCLSRSVNSAREEDVMPTLDPEELAQLLPAETAAFASPIPTQFVSSDEFMPLPQTPKQKQVEARVRELGSQLRSTRS